MGGLFVSIMYYLLKRKEKEIYIYQTLGQKKSLIALNYYLGYLFIALIVIPLSILCADKLSNILLNTMISSNIEKQRILLQYSSNYHEVLSYAPSYHINLTDYIKISLQIILILTITTIGITIQLVNNPKKH